MTVTPLIAIASDRRCWLLALTILLAVVVGFFAVPNQMALGIVLHAGFWFVLVTFLIWTRSLWLVFAADLRGIQWRKLDWLSAVIIALGGTVLLVHETFGFKIVMDELMLLGTSMSMHLDKIVQTPLRGNDIQGSFRIIEGIVDKRPLFFPFLLSLVHDLLGYRPANAFILNGVLAFVFLWLVNIVGRQLAGRYAGWLGVVLFAGLPLLAQNATGGGFELLNLVMILATMLLGGRFLEKRDGPTLTAFCFSALLLAQVRYESIIYLVPVAVLVVWTWFRERRAILTWPVMLAPLLMVHYPLQHRIFEVRASAWEMFSKPGYTEPFAFRYVTENLAHAVTFFFAPAKDQPNSLVLSVLGFIAVPFFALLVVKRLRSLAKESPAVVSTTIFSIGFALQFALMMCYFWGKFDDVVIRRLSLPTQLGMVIAVLAVLPQFTSAMVIRGLIAIATIGLLARSVPSMAAHAYEQEYLPGLETAWRRQFIAAQPHPDYLMIDNDATLWVTHLVSATPTVMAVKHRVDIAFFMRNHAFSAVYVFQRFNVDPDTGRMTLREGDDLGPAFVLEPVVEERLQLLTLSRISRVTEIKSDGASISTPDPATHVVSKNRTEVENARKLYLESYMKQLP